MIKNKEVKTYVYLLGHQPEISIKEITSVYLSNKETFEIDYSNENFLFIKAQKFFFNELGGSQKLYELLTTLPEQDWRKNSSDWIKNFFANQVFIGKLVFGISVYSVKNEKKLIFNLGKEIKTILRSDGINTRFVVPKDNIITSATAKKNQLQKKNFEIAIIPLKGKVIICKLIKVQDFELFAKSDYLRPNIDPLSGMLPPKLARTMINLAGLANNKELKILDPFVGSGTILIQAALLGYKNLFGSDISKKAIVDTKKNLEWVKENFEGTNFNYLLVEKDVLKITDLDRKFDAIITEGYLGPPLKYSSTKEEILKNKLLLERFYNNVLNVLSKVISEKGKIVLAFPFFYIKGEEIFLNLKIPVGLHLIEANPLKYRRKEQYVGRHIFELEKG